MLFVRISYPKTVPLICSSMQQASCKYEPPRLELEGSATFLAIKHCQRTKSKIVIKQSRSSNYKPAHICATSGKAVNEISNKGTHLQLLPPLKFQLCIWNSNSSFGESFCRVLNPILHDSNKERKQASARLSESIWALYVWWMAGVHCNTKVVEIRAIQERIQIA